MNIYNQLMNPLKKMPINLAAMLIALLFIIACASDPSDAEKPSGQGATQDSSVDNSRTVENLSGNIQIDGSSTVFPISEAVSEEFGIITGGDVRVLVGVSGTGGGFKKFCRGETDIANASRPIKASEVDLCSENGIEFVEVPAAIDGLSVVANLDNDFVRCVTLDELNAMWSPDAEGVVLKWAQVRPEWPSSDLSLYGPGADSGTFDYFTEVVNGESQSSRGDFLASENDNVIVQGVSGDHNSFGYFGYDYYIENKDKLKLIEIDAGQGCVSPTPETIADGSYSPFARPLFMYVNVQASQQSHIRKFIEFFLSDEGAELVEEVGYIAFQADTAKLSSSRVGSSSTGTLFGGETPKSGTVHQILEENP